MIFPLNETRWWDSLGIQDHFLHLIFWSLLKSILEFCLFLFLIIWFQLSWNRRTFNGSSNKKCTYTCVMYDIRMTHVVLIHPFMRHHWLLSEGCHHYWKHVGEHEGLRLCYEIVVKNIYTKTQFCYRMIQFVILIWKCKWLQNCGHFTPPELN